MLLGFSHNYLRKHFSVSRCKVLPVYISIVFSQVEHEEIAGLTYFTHGRTLNILVAVLFKSQ